MTTAYTSLLGLALPVTGELAGTWGDTVNDYISKYVDAAVAGAQTISGSQTAVTLSVTNGSALTQAGGSGSTGSAQYSIINCTGNPAGLLTITAPAASKVYLILNSTSTSQSVKIVGTGPTTGVTVISGEKALVAWNGSDFVKVASTAAAGGSNTQVQFNNNGVLAGSSSLTWDGTTLSTNGLTASGTVTLSGGTANGVLYLNGSKVATSGSALTFDGTNIALKVSNGTQGYVLGVGNEAMVGSDASTYYFGAGWGGAPAVNFQFGSTGTTYHRWLAGGTEQMRLDGTGLGIGTTPSYKLDVAGGKQRVTYNSTGLTSVAVYNSNNAANDGSGVEFGKSSADPFARVWSNHNSGTLYFDVTSTFPFVWRNTMTGTPNTLMTLDGSGNLGLGVTPSSSTLKSFEIGNLGVGIASGGTNNPVIAAGAYYNSGWKYAVSGSAVGLYQFTPGTGHYWQIAASGTAGNAISFTQAMTLDASGRLLVGATSASGARLDVVSGAGANTYFNSTAAGIYLQIANNSTNLGYIGDGGSLISGGGNTDFAIRSQAALTFATNGNTERARITSGGYFKASDNGTYDSSTGTFHEFYQSANNSGLFVRAVNAGLNTGGVLGITADRNTTNNTFYALSYYNNGAAAYKFRVADSGDVTNTNNSYGAISDAKMKTDIVDAGSQWADIKAIRFRKFKMKNDPSGLLQLGVVAQELEQTSPGLVEEHKDTDAEGNDLGTTTKSVKTSVLLMKAAVALQEAMARIEKLEAEVSALKGA